MKILLSDASGLTSRQIATILGRKGHVVHVLSPAGLTLTKFTRWVNKVHSVPSFGADPYVWFETALSIMKKDKFDLLLCTQEQVAIISEEKAQIEKLGVKIAVPEFNSLKRVLDKISAAETLRELSLPQPESTVISPLNNDLGNCANLLPAFLKTPIGTGSMGVQHVSTMTEVLSAMTKFEGLMGEEFARPLLIQRQIQGSLLMVSAIFSHGNLMAWHACVRVYEGLNGGASKKVSLPLPIIEEHLQTLGKGLNWHGALSLDAILLDGKPQYIDINPRIVEPMNALLSGVDLVDALIEVSIGTERIAEVPKHGMEGVGTHQLVVALLQASKEGRLVLLVEIFKAMMRFDQYAGSVEELTPLRGDPWSFLVLVAIVLMLLVGGKAQAERLTSNTVNNYALSPGGWREIAKRHDDKGGD
jgi:hypothetical protein